MYIFRKREVYVFGLFVISSRITIQFRINIRIKYVAYIVYYTCNILRCYIIFLVLYIQVGSIYVGILFYIDLKRKQCLYCLQDESIVIHRWLKLYALSLNRIVKL